VPLRVVLRWFAAGAPFVWFGFATRFQAKSDVVGTDFFERFARRVHGTILGTVGDIGLLESLDDLRSPVLKVHPVIRKFYERTSSFDLDFTIRWNPLVRPFGWIYDRLLAKRMEQLNYSHGPGSFVQARQLARDHAFRQGRSLSLAKMKNRL
jgi:hypothetical protein